MLEFYINVITVITMTAVIRKIVRIGNSRGLRLPQNLVRKYRLYEKVIIEEKPMGIVIKSADKDNHLTYEETFREMAHEANEYKDWDATLMDGIEEL